VSEKAKSSFGAWVWDNTNKVWVRIKASSTGVVQTS